MTEKILKSSRIADEIAVTIELMEEKKKEILPKKDFKSIIILDNEIHRLKEMYDIHSDY